MDAPIHPLAVHFAIALLVSGAVADALFVLLRALRRAVDPPESLRSAALWMQVGGALGAIAANLVHDSPHFPDYLAGVEAMRATFEIHDDLGGVTMVAASLLAGMRLGLWWTDRLHGRLYVAVLACGLVVAGLVGATGFYGGQLVYEYSVGVQGYLLEQTP